MSSSQVFKVNYKSFSLKITLLPIDLLKPHEATVEHLITTLLKAIIRSGRLYDPIIVDENSYVVLDGMHRLEVLKRIKARMIPVCLVDYNSNLIYIKRWFRLLSPPNHDLILKLLNQMNLQAKEVKFEKANQMVLNREAYFAIHFRNKSYAIIGEKTEDSFIAYAHLSTLEDLLRKFNISIRYLRENEAIQEFHTKYYSLIVTQQVRKNEVIRVALNGKLYAPKSTRHILPIRPKAINIPLELLTYANNIDKCNELIVKFLRGRKYKIVRNESPQELESYTLIFT